MPKEYSYQPASLIFDEVKPVVLHDIPEGVYLPKVRDVIVTKNEIIVAYQASNPVRIFDLTGKHLRHIGTMGRGPGEYTEVTSFTFDYDRNRLFIYDQWQAKICIYDLNGGFIEEVNNISTRFIHHHKNHLYLFRPGNANQIGYSEFEKRLTILDDIQFQTVHQGLPVALTSLNSDMKGKVFFSKGDTVFLNPPGSLEIIKMVGDRIVHHEENINAPGLLTKSEREQYVSLVLARKPMESIKYVTEEKQKFFGISNYTEFGDGKVFFSTTAGVFGINVAYNNGLLTYAQGFFDDLSTFSENWKPIGFSGGYFLGIIHPEDSHNRYSANVANKFKMNIKTFYEKVLGLSISDDFEEKWEAITNLVQAHSVDNDEPPVILLLMK